MDEAAVLLGEKKKSRLFGLTPAPFVPQKEIKAGRKCDGVENGVKNQSGGK